MTDVTSAKPGKKPKKGSHALRRLVGAVVVAGAAYAAEKIIERRVSRWKSSKKTAH